jgi:hypothetical protein
MARRLPRLQGPQHRSHRPERIQRGIQGAASAEWRGEDLEDQAAGLLGWTAAVRVGSADFGKWA